MGIDKVDLSTYKNHMGKTIEVAADRAYDDKIGVIPREMAKGVFIQNAPGVQATKILHLMIDKAAGRMGEDCWHEMHLRDIRKVPGMRNHDLTSLREMIYEIAASTFSFEVDVDQQRRKVGIGTFLDGGELVYDRADEGDLMIRWHFGITFRTLAEESNHWAILDRQAFFAMTSKYSLALFQQISSMVRMQHVSSCTYSVEELRQVMGVVPGKVTRWADFNRDALKPAMKEINQLTRFDVTARFIKAGRRIDKVVIEWVEKPDPTPAKKELAGSKVGRKARRNGMTEALALTFPESGTIRDAQPWGQIARDNAPKLEGRHVPDLLKLADAFRKWCAEKSIRLDATSIEKTFTTWCKSYSAR